MPIVESAAPLSAVAATPVAAAAPINICTSMIPLFTMPIPSEHDTIIDAISKFASVQQRTILISIPAPRQELAGLTGAGSLQRDPHGGDLYVFPGKSGKLIKILLHDGLDISVYAKRLERSRCRSHGG